MTEPTAAQPGVVGRYHHLLLGLAGQAPDEIVAAARRRLAEGRIAEVARALVAAVVPGHLTIGADDAAMIAAALPEVPESVLLAPSDAEPLPGYHFLPVLPTGPGQLPTVLDLTAGVLLDEPDAVAVLAMNSVEGATGLWRAWRSPNATNPGAPARVHLVETTADADRLPAITVALQDALASAGVINPQVEVYGPATELPPYHRLARGRSALLWTARPAHPVVVARVFDRVDPATGPQFAADHVVLTDDDRPDLVLDYLNGGTVLLATTERMADVLDPSLGAAVPMSYRTDGVWVWTDTVTYYLETYGLSPDADLLAHIRAGGHRMPPVDAVAEHRAMVALTAPAEKPPAWRVGTARSR